MKIEGRSMKETQISADVGICNIPDQILKKHLQRGVVFNLLVVAETGTGAKTLLTSIYNLSSFPSPSTQTGLFTEYNITLKSTCELVLKLNLFIYRGKSSEDLSEFVVERNKKYNRNNVGIKRERIEDPRIHAAAFLISPLVFKPDDLKMLKSLSELTNTIPIITKRDIFMGAELEMYQERIHGQITEQNIHLCSSIKKPTQILSTIASSTFISIDGQSVRGREYRWGAINAEDPELSDLPEVIQLLLSCHFMDIKRAANVYYQSWKKELSDEGPLSLDDYGRELLKEIEQTITERLTEKLRNYEKDEKMLDIAMKSLTVPVSVPEVGPSKDTLPVE